MNPLRRIHLFCFPPACWQCGRMMEPLPAAGAREPPGFPFLCADCHAVLPWHQAAAHTDLPGLERVWAACRYEPPVSNWIQSLKYGGRDVLVRLLARLMHDAPCGEAPLADGGWVIPVPLHRRRLRQRGFNQSYLLAHAWRAAWRETGNARPALRSRLLARQRYTRPQVELTSDAREANVAGAFLVRMPLAGRRVLLVDDVLTTGSTLRACAEALRAAGAARVEAFAVARA